MPGRWIAMRAAAAALGVISAGGAQAASPYFETQANVQAGDEEKDGSNWFETWDHGMRFVLEAKHRERSQALWEVLRQSYEHGLAVRVRFDASAARFDAKIGRFLYPICTVELDEWRFESGRSCTRAQYNPGSAEAQIALALGEYVNGSPRAAITLLDKALAESAIKQEMLKVALRARAESYETISDGELPGSEAGDRAKVAALADYRRLGALAPDDMSIQSRIGSMLQDLGDYRSARAIDEQIQRRWPDEDFNNTLRLAALDRQVGDAEASLKILNGLVERKGPQDNMRYYYHRGWTLNVLGRYDEAIAALTAGINAQPDYAYAYLRRACAYASVGRLLNAASDMESAAGYFAAIPRAEGDRSIDYNLARAKEIATGLRTAIASGNDIPMPNVCHGFWGDDDKPRVRSPLLPPA